MDDIDGKDIIWPHTLSGWVPEKKMEEIFEDLQGVKILVDDILIYGNTPEDHCKILKVLLERTRQKGIRLKKINIILQLILCANLDI